MNVREFCHDPQEKVEIRLIGLINDFRYKNSDGAFEHDEELIAHLSVFAENCLICIEFHLHLAINSVHSGKSICAILVVVPRVAQELIFLHEVLVHGLVVGGGSLGGSFEKDVDQVLHRK